MLIYLQILDDPRQASKFQQLYTLYKDTLYSAAFSILNNEHDAEDAVHQAFVKIAENFEKISDIKCPKTKSYIVTIVENTAINIYNRKKRHPILPLNDEIVGLTVEYNGTNELARCMAKLPARYRQVLLLKYHHGYSTREIARLLNLTSYNVSKLEQRAKAKLEILCKEAEIL